MNQEKHKKNVLQQSLSEEENPVPTHSRSALVLQKYIKIPKITFAGRRRRSHLLNVQDQKIPSVNREMTNSSPKK